MELFQNRFFVSISSFLLKHPYCAMAYSVNLIKSHLKHQSLESLTLLGWEGAFSLPVKVLLYLI